MSTRVPASLSWITAASLDALAAVPPAAGRAVFLTDGKRSGMFTCRAGDYSASVAADPGRGVFVPSTTTGFTWVREFGNELHSDWWGTADAYDAAAPMQRMIDLANVLGGVRCVVDRSDSFYNWREPAAVNVAMPSGTSTTAMLRVYADTDLLISSGARILNWRNYHGIIGPAAHRARICIDGILDFQAQAVDDLSAAAVAALPAGAYPYATYSGYGTETPLNIYGTMTQYAGWPYGTPQPAGARHGVWFAGSEDVVVEGKGAIRRTRGAGLRFSDGCVNCEGTGGLLIDESRLTGVSVTSGSVGCRIDGMRLRETLQVGISVYGPGSANVGVTDVANNIVRNTRPLGENGIEFVGTNDSARPFGGTASANVVEGFGANGIRGNWWRCASITGNTITRIRRSDIQRVRYPGQSGGAGLRLQGPNEDGDQSTEDFGVAGNNISDVDTWAINDTGYRNSIGANGLGDDCAFGRLISNSQVYAQYVTTLTAGALTAGALTIAAGYETVRVSAVGTITSISAGTYTGQIVVLVKTSNATGGDAPAGDLVISNSAVVLAGGASSLTLSNYFATLQIQWDGSAWTELRRALN